MSYYNTTESLGAELRAYQRQANRQDDLVLAAFRGGKSLTPSMIWNMRILGDAPLTSVRRAMTNLTNAGLLVKTDDQRMGLYGKKEFVWRLPVEQRSLFA